MAKKLTENVYYQQHLLRMRVIKLIRKFLDERGFQEVLCPILHQSVPAEPTIYPFETHWNRYLEEKLNSKPLYLPISPERAMKHYLAAGFPDCYSIGHCFRNLEGKSSTHHPEFLMLEWYRHDHDYHSIMTDTHQLLVFLAQEITGNSVVTWQEQQYDLDQWPILSVEELWQEHFGCSIRDILTVNQLADLARAHGCNPEGADWEQLFDQLMLNEIEPLFPSQPFFLLDFPAQLSPLCRPRADKPWLAERFEVYVGGVELGNGNSEHLDGAKIRTLFQAELQTRHARGEATQPLDEEMIADIETMATSGHQFAGIGLGVDRVAMMLGDYNSIDAWWPIWENL